MKLKWLLVILALLLLAAGGIVTSQQSRDAQPAIESYFSPDGGIQNRIIEQIDKTKSSIDIAVYSFTDNKIAKALIKAEKRGVAIRVIVDSEKARDGNSQTNYLEKKGVGIKCLSGKKIKTKDKGNEADEDRLGSMHHKFIIFDGVEEGRLLMTGSYNLSAGAEKYNYENVIFIPDKPVIQMYQEIFETLWNKVK